MIKESPKGDGNHFLHPPKYYNHFDKRVPERGRKRWRSESSRARISHFDKRVPERGRYWEENDTRQELIPHNH